MADFYSFNQIERAVLQEKINKYYPKFAKFTVPALLPNASGDNVKYVNSSNVKNKGAKASTGSITTGNTITLKIPKDVILSYPDKFVPKGTVFTIAFMGGDSNSPRIIGRECKVEDEEV